MKANKEKLDPKVFELAAQLFYVRYSNWVKRYYLAGCCIAIKCAYNLIYNDYDTPYRDLHTAYLASYFRPKNAEAYWWTQGDKTPRHIALTICAEILKDENKT